MTITPSSFTGMANRRGLLALLVAALMIMAAACAPPAENGDNDNDNDELPDEVQEWVDNVRQVHAGHVFNHDGQTYILVSYGEQASDAYQVEITDVGESDGALVVTAEFTAPAENGDNDDVYYPYDLHVMDETDMEIVFDAEGDEVHVPTVINLEQGEPLPTITAGSIFIKVFEPAPEETVGQEFTLHGMSNVFEGNTVYEVVQDDEVVFEDFTTTTMGDWAIFEETISLPEEVTGEVLLRVYAPDQSNGEAEGVENGRVFTVEIPLTVTAGD